MGLVQRLQQLKNGKRRLPQQRRDEQSLIDRLKEKVEKRDDDDGGGDVKREKKVRLQFSWSIHCFYSRSLKVPYYII